MAILAGLLIGMLIGAVIMFIGIGVGRGLAERNHLTVTYTQPEDDHDNL